MEFHMIDITYAAMHIRAQTEKTTFSCKDDCRSILEWGKGLVKKSRLYPARAYTTLVVLVYIKTNQSLRSNLLVENPVDCDDCVDCVLC